MRAFILTPTYRVREGVPEVHLHGVLESGEPCLIVDDRSRPYFFIRATERSRVALLAPQLDVADTTLRSFDGDAVARVTVATPGDVPPLRGRLGASGI